MEELETAAKAGRVQTTPGFGAAKEKNIIEAIERGRRLRERQPLFTAWPYAARLASELARCPEVTRAEVAGSIRRRRDTIGDLDLVAATTDLDATAAAIAQLPGVTEVFESGPSHVSAMTDLDLRLDVRLGKPADFGALLHHFSSGRQHNIELRDLAESKGLKINEYGVFDAKTGAEKSQGEDEGEIYAALGLPYIEPELREGRGEIETAKRGELPRLITEADFRGQLHEHSTWSDGTATIRQMAQGAIERGYEYLAITDHSGSLAIANGLSRERLLAQLDEIAQVKVELAPQGFTLLSGIEADILADGSLDADDDLLARLDIVVGSVHIRHKEDEAAMTKRVLRAIENPRLHILGHPTGRLVGRREPFPIDMNAVIEAAVRTGVILEINASPDRMDLNDTYARHAREKGARLAINADAHSVAGLGQLSWGLHMARRAWLTPADVINTYPLAELRKALKPRSR